MIVRVTLVIASALVLGRADAGAPKQTAAFGIALDATPDFVKTFLATRYKACSIATSVYRNRPDETSTYIAELAINPGFAAHDPGTLDLCTYSPAGIGVTDAIDARFAHPDVDRSQPLYSLEVFRTYPDVVYEKPRRVRFSFDDVRDELFRIYGNPIDQRRERIASSAADRAASLGVDEKVVRDDYLVRYLWAAKGRMPDVEHDDVRCDCIGRYVKAVIEISRSPSTIPRNKFYAVSVKVIVEDADLRIRQDARDAQWRQHK